jgi:hypothetical protein
MYNKIKNKYMKKFKKIIMALVCSAGLFAATMTTTSTAATETQGSISCYYIDCWNKLYCIDNGSAGPPSIWQYNYTELVLHLYLCVLN